MSSYAYNNNIIMIKQYAIWRDMTCHVETHVEYTHRQVMIK